MDWSGNLDKLTKEQAVIVSAYTGYMMCDTPDLLDYLSKKLGREIAIDDLFNDPNLRQEAEDASFEDFEKICCD